MDGIVPDYNLFSKNGFYEYQALIPKKFAKKAPAKRAPIAKGTFKKAGPNKNAGKPKPRAK